LKKPVFDRDRSRLSVNLSPLFVVFVLVMSAVFGRVLYLQTVLGSELTKQSEANRIRHETIPAQRGMILDRDGEILAADEPVFHLQTRRGLRSMNTRQVRTLAEGLNLKFERLRERLKSEQRHFLLRGMTDAQRIWFEENSHRFPGLEVKIRPKRVYQHGRAIAPVVGYTGEINPAMLSRRRDEGLSQGSIVGKTGVEKVYDRSLQGRNGIRWIEVSAKGERIRTLQSPSPTPPRHGRSLRLNIDLDLQQLVAQSFPSDSAGAAVVMEVPNGRIRALYSHPTYNPNALTIAGSRRINRLLEAEEDPLHNRAIQSRFPPGSTFKVLPFLAAHADDNFRPDQEFDCDGEFQLGTGTFECWEESGHGSLDLIEGLVNSCNVYFYNLVRELGWSEVIDTARRLQFNRPSGVDLPDEADPQLSTPSLKESRYGRPWVEGDALNAVIGQGYTLTSPIKQAQLLGGLVTGRRVKPSVARRAVPDRSLPELDVSSSSREALLETMDAVTDRGTGYWAQHDTSYRTIEPDILGKTGTVQKVKTDDEGDTPPSDAWFISAAPADDPRYVVVVFRIEGGTGGSVAAPHARRIYQSMDRLGYFSGDRDRRAAAPEGQDPRRNQDRPVGSGEG
jgi:penicillin-binding protein 2